MYGDNDGVKVTPDKPPEELEPTPDLLTDVYLNASILLSLGEKMARGEVVYRKQYVDGNPIGCENANPILDSHWYEVEFDYGEVTELTVNVIAERVYDQCDENGNVLLMIYSFVDYQKSERAMSLQDQQITVNGRSCKKRSKDGREIFFWKYHRTTWERLADLKECYPVDTAEYLVIQKVDHKPSFNWWVKRVLQKQDRIVAKVWQRGGKKYAKTTMKFGIEFLKTVYQALDMDKKKSNNLWADAIAK